MQAWEAGLVISGAGAVGGIPSAFLLSEDRGIALPYAVTGADGTKIYRPGFLGHLVVGAVAAFLSWGLYGPLANTPLIGGSSSGPGGGNYSVTIGAFAGAIGVGLGGAQWLANYVDKELFHEAAATAARKPANQKASKQIAQADPSEAWGIAEKLTGEEQAPGAEVPDDDQPAA
ncbi:hypothetical protein [Streptomyces decoyicus]|uniref:hypothetical protein n=1 Tax=Streptomyces decoyicus TaxID=249567 RepID=UPI0033B6CBF4